MYDATLAPDQGPVLPASRPVRRGRSVSLTRSGQRVRRGTEGAGQDLRVPHLRGRRPRVLLGEPDRLPPRSRRRRLAENPHLVRPLPGLLTPAQWRRADAESTSPVSVLAP